MDPRCKYCSEDAWAVLLAWRFGPPEYDEHDDPYDREQRAEASIPVCRTHRTTGLLRLTSMGYGTHQITETEVGTIYPGGRS